MWSLKTKNNWELVFDTEENIVKKVSKFSKITGWFLIILWIIWLVVPYLTTIATLGFVSYLLIFAWISIFYFTYLSNKKDWLWYLKWFVLFISWILLIVNINLGLQVLAIIFIMYFFIDWFINLLLAIIWWFKNGSWIWFVNAILLFLLAAIFISSWWNKDLLGVLIWIFVWISLFFDGISLLITWRIFNKFIWK